MVIIALTFLRHNLLFSEGHDKNKINAEWGNREADRHWSVLIASLIHVLVTFSRSLYTTVRNPNHNPNPNCNPTVITDPQIGPRDSQIVTVHSDPPRRSVFCRVPFSDAILWVSLRAKHYSMNFNAWVCCSAF